MAHTISQEILSLKETLIQWRHHLHARPETAFEEKLTTQYITEQLQSFGVDEILTHFAQTGVVALINGKSAGKTIGLRADIDALDGTEQSEVEYRSIHHGKMHACGHDGHTSILLGTAKYLAKNRDFAGSVVLIFQPAEENEGGARVMVENGLFNHFHIDYIFGLHNQPGQAVNQFATCEGPIKAAYDIFEISLTGKGGHAGRPDLSHDVIITATQVVNALQTIVSRNADPLDAVVISVTQIQSGDTWNVLPQHATIRGTVRTLRTEAQDMVEKRIAEIANGIATTFNAKAKLHYERRYPVTINDPVATQLAVKAAAAVVGKEMVDANSGLSMGSEDFSFFSQLAPGSYMTLGSGNGPGLHHPSYNFNDEILVTGVAYFAQIVKELLG